MSNKPDNVSAIQLLNDGKFLKDPKAPLDLINLKHLDAAGSNLFSRLQNRGICFDLAGKSLHYGPINID
ncbi:hypothetical protein PsB1_1298 [Candidatus Phycosocius spiralis]|uniref:Uncharacterized protein n=1 Tax=Candidatus Phycosocius spiralis TaxID=2815099 RepID=A0ABQ4PVY2_9PROT|nr:hypothetical protein PsB1_1298 [Candidatus Phycosocius spiralis]